MSLAVGCQEPDRIDLEQCGNGIVEPDSGEDCEPVQDPERCGAPGTGALACRWICAEQACPEGFACGVDAICRQPCLGHQGAPACDPFERLSTDVTTDRVVDVTLADVDRDGRPEILTVESSAIDSGATVRIYDLLADGFVAGPGYAIGERPTVARLEDGGPLSVLAARDPLPPPPAFDPDAARASVARFDDDLGLQEVIVQGPRAVPDGPIALTSVTIPPDVPVLGGRTMLLGFRQSELWPASDDDPPLPLTPSGDPAALVGPVAIAPWRQGVALASGDLASEYCPTLLWGYQGADVLMESNPCDGVDEGWTTAPLALPSLPAGEAMGDGLAIGDANGDGLPDVALTTAAGRTHVSYAVGDGTFHSDAMTLPATAGDGQFDAGVGFVQAPVGSVGVIAVGRFDDDGRPDLLTRSTWIRSCSVEGCGTCDVPGYRCDPGPGQAPLYDAAPGSVLDYDGDGSLELAVLAVSGDERFRLQDWGPVTPTTGDLVIVERPGSQQWAARIVPTGGAQSIRSTGDLDGDGRDDVVLTGPGDALTVVFGGSDEVRQIVDFATIVDAHVATGTLAVISEDADGGNRRLSRLTATWDRRLRSETGLPLSVMPRRFVVGRFDPEHPESRGIVVLGEPDAGTVGAELLTRGNSSLFDGANRNATVTSLGIAREHAGLVTGVAIDLDGDAIDELVVFAPGAAVRTSRVEGATPRLSAPVEQDIVAELFGPAWPPHVDVVGPGSVPRLDDLDGDGDDDLWMLTADDQPALISFENLGDGRLAPGTLLPMPPPELSVCEDPDCRVLVRVAAPFAGASDRTLSLGSGGRDILLVSRRALFLWTVAPLDRSTADILPPVELAVVQGGRAPLSPDDRPVLGAVADIDGDGVDDVIAGGDSGIRWLRGLAVTP